MKAVGQGSRDKNSLTDYPVKPHPGSLFSPHTAAAGTTFSFQRLKIGKKRQTLTIWEGGTPHETTAVPRP